MPNKFCVIFVMQRLDGTSSKMVFRLLRLGSSSTTKSGVGTDCSPSNSYLATMVVRYCSKSRVMVWRSAEVVMRMPRHQMISPRSTQLNLAESWGDRHARYVAGGVQVGLGDRLGAVEVPLEQAIVGRQCQQYPQGAVTHNR
jgi:hypothetical protein